MAEESCLPYGEQDLYIHRENTEREGGRGKDRRHLGARQIFESQTLVTVFL